MTKRAFIWDLDGTLLDSYDVFWQVLRRPMQLISSHLTEPALKTTS